MRKFRLTANWGLKLASLIFAAVLWFLVTNINNPIVAVRFGNVPVTIKNASLITDAGDVYEVVDNTDVISTVTVLAPRSIADSFSKENIVAVADVNDLTSRNTVNIQLSVNKYSNEIDNISGSIDTLKLNIEKKKTATLPLQATTSGTLSDGYIIGDVSTEQNMIRITGPESVIQKVNSAAVDVDVTGFTSNIGTDADIKLYDANGKVINNDSIQMNISSVRVNVQILQDKYVTLHYTLKGKPADGYMLTGKIESTPDKILIAGKSSALQGIETIEITDDKLDVSGLRSDLETTIDLDHYLPSGISFGDDDFNGVVSVVVYIEPIRKETLEIPLSQIALQNIPDGFKAIVKDNAVNTDSMVPLEIQGLNTVIGAVKPSDITGTIDLSSLTDNGSELKEGTYKELVTFTLPDGVTADKIVSVSVELTGNGKSGEAASANSNASE